jgi:hypothetical protein
MANYMMDLTFEVCVFNFEVIFLHGVKSYDMGPTALLLRKKACCGHLSPLKIHRLRPGFNA